MHSPLVRPCVGRVAKVGVNVMSPSPFSVVHRPTCPHIHLSMPQSAVSAQHLPSYTTKRGNVLTIQQGYEVWGATRVYLQPPSVRQKRF